MTYRFLSPAEHAAYLSEMNAREPARVTVKLSECLTCHKVVQVREQQKHLNETGHAHYWPAGEMVL